MIRRLDQWQRSNRPVGIAVATARKFVEDGSAALAAAMAFWAFFSLFPLLLATVTVLGFVLPEADRADFLGEVAGYLPLLDVATIGALTGSWPALLVGVGTALWSGTAVIRMTQQAFARIWEVPAFARPNLPRQLLRSLLTLATLGLGMAASIGTIAFLTTGRELRPINSLLGLAAAVAVDCLLFLIAFRLLTARSVHTRALLPGALFCGVCFWALQMLSTLIITQYLADAEHTYGSFATVITMLWWFYLQAQVTLLGMQLNVVLAQGYHPRALGDGPPGPDAGSPQRPAPG